MRCSTMNKGNTFSFFGRGYFAFPITRVHSDLMKVLISSRVQVFGFEDPQIGDEKGDGEKNQQQDFDQEKTEPVVERKG